MTTKEQYEAWDQAGFNGDDNIFNKVKELCETHHITSIVETGTRYGNTTKRLAGLASTVTCELDELNFQIAKQNLVNKETGKDIALCFNCDSIEFMKLNLVPMKNQRILFYLDAHGAKGTPLLEELNEIAEAGIKPVICIHDFVVPGRSDLGFDTYNGQPYTFEWIQNHLEKIYGDEGFNYSFNEEADGAMRGIIYIEPKEAMKPRKGKLSEESIKNKIRDHYENPNNSGAPIVNLPETKLGDPIEGTTLKVNVETNAGLIDKTKKK